MSKHAEKPAYKVGLFVTCLVDVMRPNVGFAAVKLLEDAGCQVAVPESQTCCGQPAFNSGDNADTAKIAKGVIEAFEGFDYVVAPSGSCAAMIKEHYAELFDTDPHWAGRAHELSARTYELTSFLVDICGMQFVEASLDAKITYHDSCSGLRELSVKEQPRKLLKSVDGLEIQEMKRPETCCGFGGTFCVKYPEISGKIVDEKSDDIISTDADILLAGDLGCLLNMSGKMHRKDAPVKAYHVAEVLADMADGPAIGAPSKPFTLDSLKK
ncbi:(Fe-S)-binding protein [Curvivirga aplysinae]|uniref:(Fe-S)-binding protein n=1 Tax=Curvivirga aplysinae TaxID=2529852 RepID=UPI0012BC8D5B|nr:(Fe-S)-binding protein [Curvivirga aplysinae]MTI09087.1 (Fe-S)-binding protein [Curvivirga aplysinae]